MNLDPIVPTQQRSLPAEAAVGKGIWWLWRSLGEQVLILLPEAVPSRVEVPASLLVHLPHIRLLAAQGADGGEEHSGSTAQTAPGIAMLAEAKMRSG